MASVLSDVEPLWSAFLKRLIKRGLKLRGRWSKLAALMDDSEHDVLAYLACPTQHHAKSLSTNPLEPLNKEVMHARPHVIGYSAQHGCPPRPRRRPKDCCTISAATAAASFVKPSQ